MNTQYSVDLRSHQEPMVVIRQYGVRFADGNIVWAGVVTDKTDYNYQGAQLPAIDREGTEGVALLRMVTSKPSHHEFKVYRGRYIQRMIERGAPAEDANRLAPQLVSRELTLVAHEPQEVQEP